MSFFSACETKTGCQELHPVTAEQIDGTIQDGKTSKATILSLFGHDFDLSLDSKNRERWIYSLDVVNHMSRNFIPYNFFSRGFLINHKQLMIVFDENDIVEYHFFHTYDEAAKMGI